MASSDDPAQPVGASWVSHYPGPYTRGLVGCVPRVDTRLRPMPTLPGSIQGVWDISAGCRFAPRCASAIDVCRVREPELWTVEPQHESACWVYAGPPEAARE